MECKKCNVEVPSQFEYVLSQNVCPKCGQKLMATQAMAIYLELKTKLKEIEFVMDMDIVCERIAMFMVSNYEVMPLGNKNNSSIKEQAKLDTNINDLDKITAIKAQLASIAEDGDLSPEEIRAEEASRAEEIAAARESGLDPDLIGDEEEMVSGKIDEERVRRLKKLALSNGNKTGPMVRRTT
jgi:hypothetical protein